MAEPHAHDHSHHDHSGHDPGHNPGHAGHSHAPKDFGMAFALGTALNIGIVVLEATYGFIANSVALLADAGHNLGDVFGLLMAWGASALVKRRPTARYTYGFQSSSILAALANGVVLMLTTGAIAWEAATRLAHPEPAAGLTVMIVAAIGILVNGLTALMFVSGRKDDINIRGAFLHMAGDAAISLGVVLAGAAMLLTGWLWIDPVVSIAISVIIVWATWGLLRESANLALHAVPPGIDPARVRSYLAGLPGVASVHDLHIWPMSTTATALTCHLVMPAGHPGDAFIAKVAHGLEHDHAIAHATVQIEQADGAACALEPDHVV
jgi:cobalt-zinc-cadmium efflux system protein